MTTRSTCYDTLDLLFLVLLVQREVLWKRNHHEIMNMSMAEAPILYDFTSYIIVSPIFLLKVVKRHTAAAISDNL